MPRDGDTPRPTAITNAADAAIVKGMLERGDPIHDVAAWFGINSGRIAAVKKGYKEGLKFRDVPPAPEHALPPPGPYSYFTPRPGMSIADQLQQALAAVELKWAQALATIREELRVSANERRQTNEKIDQLQHQLVSYLRELKLIENPKAPRPTRRDPMGS